MQGYVRIGVHGPSSPRPDTYLLNTFWVNHISFYLAHLPSVFKCDRWFGWWMIWSLLIENFIFIPPCKHPKTLSLTKIETETGFIFDYWIVRGSFLKGKCLGENLLCAPSSFHSSAPWGLQHRRPSPPGLPSSIPPLPTPIPFTW